MDSQPQQRFCVNCGQPVISGVAFCTNCGRQVGTSPASTPSQFPAGAQQVYSQPYPQAPTQSQDDPLLAGMAAGYVASQMGHNPVLRARRTRSRLRGYGCLLQFS